MSTVRFWRDSSERLTFDLPGVSALDFPAVCRAVADEFALTPGGSLVMGLQQISWDFRRNELMVGLDWDIWMEFMVVAKTQESERLVREIGDWLSLSQWAKATKPS
jgi:hypothetical protein